jgi:hypothetical protein
MLIIIQAGQKTARRTGTVVQSAAFVRLVSSTGRLRRWRAESADVVVCSARGFNQILRSIRVTFFVVCVRSIVNKIVVNFDVME